MKLKAKPIKFIAHRKNHYYLSVNDELIGYVSRYRNNNRWFMNVSLIFEDVGITVPQAKLKAQQILDKFVNDIGECENEKI